MSRLRTIGGHGCFGVIRLSSVVMPSFADLGLDPEILEAIHDVGYESPSPIQEEAIPPLLEGLDVIGQAQTGSGKTAAFGLPMLQYVNPAEREVQGLVLTPTRELCIQVTQALRAYGRRKGVDVVAVFGGAPIRSQQAQLRAGGHVVVGTVGRVKDLISRHSLMLHGCRFIVLDEADEMLDLGFLEDVERILSLTPSSRQTALFSATMPPEIRRLADQYLYDPVTVKVQAATLTVDTVEQFALEVRAREKADKLVEVLSCRAARPGDRVRADQGPHRPAVPHAARPRDERQGDPRRHDPGRPRRRDDLVQGRPPAAAGRDRRGRARARHLGHLARDQLRRSDLAGRVRPSDRPHRSRRPQRPRDHVRRAPAAARAPRAREQRRRHARAMGRGRARRTDPGEGQAAPALQAARPLRRRRPGAAR